MGPPPTRADDPRATARRLLARLRPQRLLVATIAALALGSVGAAVAGPRILGRALDLVFAGLVSARLPEGASQEDVVAGMRARGEDRLADLFTTVRLTPGRGIDYGAVERVLLLALAVYLLASLLALVQGRLATLLVQRLVRGLREDAQAKLSRVPLRAFDGRPRGEVLSRVTNDVDNLAQTLQQTLSQIVTSVLTVLGVLVMMLVISPLLAVIALVTVPLSVLSAAVIGKRAQPHFAAQWRVTGQLNGHIEEMYTGHALVRVFGRGQQAREVFDEHNEALYRAGVRAQALSGLIQPVMLFIGNLSYVLVAVAGALRVATGALSIGEVQAFIQYSRQFGWPLGQLATMANLLQSGLASAERVFVLLDEPEEEPDAVPTLGAAPGSDDVPGGGAVPAGTGCRVTFEHVSFRYDPQTPLIEDLSLDVEPGSTVAIVGPTGAGKTTLVNLLMRFYELDEGRITLDGVDIRDLPRRDLRRRVGMVLQEAWLFDGTVADNIRYGAPDADGARLERAVQATHVDRFVSTLPQGYDTVLDEEDTTVSAGERQLLTIARAFMTEPAVLVLDEATSAVDTRTEVLIQRAMGNLRRGRTSFVIAHRLSTIRDADLILVLEAGRIVERGTHHELLAVGGAYARLYAAQFEEAAEDPQAAGTG